MDINDLILNNYPFIILGGTAATVACLYATVVARKGHFVLWWLFIGIVINMAAMTGENALFFLARSPDFVHLNLQTANQATLLAVFKTMYAFAAWFHFWGAVAALRGWNEKRLKSILLVGTAVYVFVLGVMSAHSF